MELSFDEDIEKRMPAEVRDKMNATNIEAFQKAIAHHSPITQGYIEALFADPMAWEALMLVCLVCYGTRKSLENLILGTVLEQSLLNELAHAEPKGNA
jgi:hypothetical protein